jgi:hypothetical protein
MLDGPNNSLNEDEKTIRPRDNSVEERFLWQGVERYHLSAIKSN